MGAESATSPPDIECAQVTFVTTTMDLTKYYCIGVCPKEHDLKTDPATKNLVSSRTLCSAL